MVTLLQHSQPFRVIKNLHETRGETQGSEVLLGALATPGDSVFTRWVYDADIDSQILQPTGRTPLRTYVIEAVARRQGN
jgi:hypothetical protein